MEEIKILHKCAACTNTFDSEEQYIAHTCSDGVAPTDPTHAMGEKYAQIQNAALTRGATEAEKQVAETVQTQE